jgi:hypothetical protein
MTFGVRGVRGGERKRVRERENKEKREQPIDCNIVLPFSSL